jgi:hypothetical protein
VNQVRDTYGKLHWRTGCRPRRNSYYSHCSDWLRSSLEQSPGRLGRQSTKWHLERHRRSPSNKSSRRLHRRSARHKRQVRQENSDER